MFLRLITRNVNNILSNPLLELDIQVFWDAQPKRSKLVMQLLLALDQPPVEIDQQHRQERPLLIQRELAGNTLPRSSAKRNVMDRLEHLFAAVLEPWATRAGGDPTSGVKH